MVRSSDVIAYWKSIADVGGGHDADGYYGNQCVDVTNGTAIRYFGIALWGNAIDLLNSAQASGLEVIYDAPGVNPKAGDCFVMAAPDHGYGHTGIVIEDSDGYTLKTIEQNVDGYRDDNFDGINDQFQVGGPARYVTRDFTGVIGWIRFPYDDVSADIAPIAVTGEKWRKLKDETATFTVQVTALNVRSEPSLTGEVVACYAFGAEVHYDSVYVGDGYIWVSYIGLSGNRRYIACGIADGDINIAPFGTFE